MRDSTSASVPPPGSCVAPSIGLTSGPWDSEYGRSHPQRDIARFRSTLERHTQNLALSFTGQRLIETSDRQFVYGHKQSDSLKAYLSIRGEMIRARAHELRDREVER